MKQYIQKFFNELELYDDKYRQKNNKEKILNRVLDFLENSNYDTAFKVYEAYFEAYRIGLEEEENPFMELISNMSKYERASGNILDGQRDHLVHSLNVFLLGICVYINIEEFRAAFKNKIEESGYKDAYPTTYEEFFYRWGITSLFHDIAYPIEVSLKQLKKYAEVLNMYLNEESKFDLSIHFKNMNNILFLQEDGEILSNNIEKFYNKYPNISKKSNNTIDLLSQSLANIFEIPEEDLKNGLAKKQMAMEHGAFIDHGYYSALICLKWYYNLFTKYDWNLAFYYYSVIDAATAILLHNHFARGIKDVFNTDKLSVQMSPMSFLLILCDELQEWDRVRFSSNNIEIKKSKIILNDDDNMLNIKYIVNGNSKKIREKKEKLEGLLQTEGIINLNIEVE